MSRSSRMTFWSRRSQSMGCAVSTETGGPERPAAPGASPDAGARAGFDLDLPWRLDERVAVRPESFGALLYHFGTRRLSFLKDTVILAVLRSLAEYPSARSA